MGVDPKDPWAKSGPLCRKNGGPAGRRPNKNTKYFCVVFLKIVFFFALHVNIFGLEILEYVNNQLIMPKFMKL